IGKSVGGPTLWLHPKRKSLAGAHRRKESFYRDATLPFILIISAPNGRFLRCVPPHREASKVPSQQLARPSPRVGVGIYKWMREPMMRSIIALTFATLTTSVMAADMPLKAPAPPPAPVYNWTGCYVKGGGGYGMWNQDTTGFDDSFQVGP